MSIFHRKKKIRLILTDSQLRIIRTSMIWKRNQLIATGHYTDAIDELLPKLIR